MDRHIWRVTGAHDFTPLATTHHVNRFERWTYNGAAADAARLLEGAWPALRDDAGVAGAASVWLLHQPDEKQIGVLTVAARTAAKTPGKAASRSLDALARTPSPGRLLPDALDATQVFDWTSLILAMWLPEARMLGGAPPPTPRHRFTRSRPSRLRNLSAPDQAPRPGQSPRRGRRGGGHDAWIPHRSEAQTAGSAPVAVTFEGRATARRSVCTGLFSPWPTSWGPVTGSLLTETDLFGLSWRPIFLFNMPAGLAVLVLGRGIHLRIDRRKGRPADLTGTLLSALAVVRIVFPLTEGHLHHWPLWCFAMLATGLLAPGVHLRHQQNEWDNARSCSLSLARGQQFSGGTAAQLMLGLLCGLFFMTWSLYLQRGLDMSPFHAALAFVLLSPGELAGDTLEAKSAGASPASCRRLESSSRARPAWPPTNSRPLEVRQTRPCWA